MSIIYYLFIFKAHAIKGFISLLKVRTLVKAGIHESTCKHFPKDDTFIEEDRIVHHMFYTTGLIRYHQRQSIYVWKLKLRNGFGSCV